MLKWAECNSGPATVGSVVCTVYMSGQPCKPCILCEIGCRKYAVRNGVSPSLFVNPV